ncbi:LLM class flavin-dependent oxidoreductase [Mycolicibacterium baixiangningiae]|uniref:LLM class flavin-dependent oxidoreductase n=1 Tax=Mycolicibacterium baixiangningiae TaxID=2761578 RepID=UPI00186818B2|nr:LLM class flavin-dependent oxidoreductase [Mycolicibacterium baixiangningiae]
MEISCAFATASNTPAHVRLAESLGYERAWLYESPAVVTDVWMVLSRCAEQTTRIGIGPGVLVPSLRHPMVNASAIAELVNQAPGRVAVAVGAGFTGRLALGERPMRWQHVADYVRCLRALLAGETAEWQGARLRMMQLLGFGAPRPIDVPILVAADGPKGLAVATELGDGLFSVAPPGSAAAADLSWRAQLCFGTVLDDGEEVTSPRAVGAVAAAAVLHYHAVYERLGAVAVDALPGGPSWRAELEARPRGERHLAIHLVEPGPQVGLDRLVRCSGAVGLTGTAAQVADEVARYAAAGVTELVYQPAGPDIERELDAFARAAGLTRQLP